MVSEDEACMGVKTFLKKLFAAFKLKIGMFFQITDLRFIRQSASQLNGQSFNTFWKNVHLRIIS
jgi:hypothetical protein